MATPWILKISTKKVVFLVSSGKSQISPLFVPRKNFGKIPWWPPPGNPSDPVITTIIIIAAQCRFSSVRQTAPRCIHPPNTTHLAYAITANTHRPTFSWATCFWSQWPAAASCGFPGPECPGTWTPSGPTQSRRWPGPGPGRACCRPAKKTVTATSGTFSKDRPV